MDNKERGSALISVIVAAGIGVAVAFFLADIVRNQWTSTRLMSQKYDTFDLRSNLLRFFDNLSLCACQLDADSAFNASGDPNQQRARLRFNRTASPVPPIALNKLRAGCQPDSPLLVSSVATGNENVVPGSLHGLKVARLLIRDLVPAGVGNLYNGILEVAFDTGSSVMGLAPLVFNRVFEIDPASPAANTRIRACVRQERAVFSEFQVFDVAGTFTVPPGVDEIMIEAWGGGGGGGGSRWFDALNTAGGGGGGGGGGYAKGIAVVTAGQTFAVRIGDAGLGGAQGTGTSNASDGTDASDTSFGTLLQVDGGRAGNGSIQDPATGLTQVGTGGVGGCRAAPNECACAACRSFFYVDGGTGSPGDYNYADSTHAYGGVGGASPNGGAGGAVNAGATTARTASLPGGGGGGGIKYDDLNTARPGSDGAKGRVIVWW